MSFGFGVGDFITVGQLCFDIYKKCKDSAGNYAELSSEVSSLYTVIKQTEELLEQQRLTSEQQARLVTCRQGCEDVLNDLDGLLTKYESLGTNSKRAFDRMRFGMKDMTEIRLRLISNVTMLDAFNNSSSHARLEQKLNLLITEIRAGKREGSIISNKTLVQDDRETWEAFRRELEDIGVSPTLIAERRQYIITWFQKAIAAGRLDEDPITDDDDTESLAVAHASDDVTAPDSAATVQHSSSSSIARARVRQQGDENLITRSVSSSEPQRLRERPLLSWSFDESWLRLPYLMNRLKFRGKLGDEQENADRKRRTNMLEIWKGRLEQGTRRLDDQLDKMRHPEAIKPGEDLKMQRRIDVKKMLDNVMQGDDDVTQGEKDITQEVSINQDDNIKQGEDANKPSEGRNEYREEDNKRMMEAIKAEDEQALRDLLYHDVDVNFETDPHEPTALHLAAWLGNYQIVQLLLDKGAEINAISPLGVPSYFGYETAIHSAAEEGHQSIVQLLLDHGADVNMTISELGETPLMKAARKGHDSTVSLLHYRGAYVNTWDCWGDTSLVMAAREGHHSTVHLLLDRGARVNLRKPLHGDIPLVKAAAKGHHSIVRLLLDRDADINLGNLVSGDTPLIKAAEGGHYLIVSLLLDRGADPTVQNKERHTALFMAALNGNREMMRLLIDKGATVSPEDKTNLLNFKVDSNVVSMIEETPTTDLSRATA